jgi:pyruvate dehydrogenase E2 component (dihydrolipoamide acetyltransferase)
MPTPVELPKLGNTVEECLIAKWTKHPGEKVDAGETVVEIETDKAVQEIASPVAGILLATFFPEGEFVPVFTNLFVVGEPGEDVETLRPGSLSAAAAEASSVTPVAATIESRPIAVAVAAASAPLSPRARRFAEEHNFRPASVSGSGPGGRILEDDLRQLYHASPRVSSAAQQRMAQSGLVAGEGTGIGGMVLSADLVAASTTEKLPRMRERIAQRMKGSLASTAQYTLNTSANAGGLLTLRARIKASQGAADANINDMVMWCTAQALLESPELNVEFLDGQLVKHSEVHLGMAVDTPRGLMVPVIRDAQWLSLGEFAARAKELTAQAVQGTISPDDLAGATFTVSNLGGLGVESFTPILNPPQVAILGVDAIQIKAIRRDGRVEFIDAIGLSLTLDHQIIDGAPGARFLKVLREKIENVEAQCAI